MQLELQKSGYKETTGAHQLGAPRPNTLRGDTGFGMTRTFYKYLESAI
jgi:hypothetical protein